MIEQALNSLAKSLSIAPSQLQQLLDAAYVHDWQNDPFSRGANSYGGLGAAGAQKEFAAPLQDTLFFAGEATDATGHVGTVHGAIASGRRAAQEVIRSFA